MTTTHNEFTSPSLPLAILYVVAGHAPLDLKLGHGEIRPHVAFLPVDDHRRVRASSVAQRRPEALDGRHIDDADLDVRAVAIEELMRPVGDLGELGSEVLRQRLPSLIAVQPLADPRLPERDLAVLAVEEHRGCVRDDLDADGTRSSRS